MKYVKSERTILKEMNGHRKKINEIIDVINDNELERTYKNLSSNLSLCRLGKKTYFNGAKYGSIQGMCHVGNNRVACGYASDAVGNLVKLVIMDIFTGEVIDSNILDLGHCNGMVYVDGYIYVANSRDYSTLENIKVISKVSLSSLTIVSTITLPAISLNNVGELAYNSETKEFIVSDYTKSCEVYDKDFNFLRTLYCKIYTYDGSGYQSMCCRNNKLYRLTINPQTIYQLDMEGNVEKVYNINEYQGLWFVGEIQHLTFDDSGYGFIRSIGKLTSTSEGVETFWRCNFDTDVNIYDNTYDKGWCQYAEHKIYVDISSEIYKADGSSTKPFRTIDEAIIFMQSPFMADKNVVCNVKSNSIGYYQIYGIGLRNKTFYLNKNNLSLIKLIACSNVYIYDYHITNSINITKSIVNLAGGTVISTLSNPVVIERSTVISDSESIGLTESNSSKTISLNKNSVITLSNGDNKRHWGLLKDSTSKVKSVRLLKGELTNSNITLPSNFRDFANVEIRVKLPRGYTSTKFFPESTLPRLSLCCLTNEILTVYNVWSEIIDNVFSLGANVIIDGVFSDISDEILFDVALWD